MAGNETAVYLFNNSSRFHYIPLFAHEYKIDNFKGERFLVVENDDMAIALSFLSNHHNYDLIICAGGENNAGDNFLQLFSTMYAQVKGKWRYFGDYDSAGFKIFEDIHRNLHMKHNLSADLEFVILPQERYRELLLAFGARIRRDKKGQGKNKVYKKILQSEEDFMIPLKPLIRENLEYQKELEQNILVYISRKDDSLLIS